MPSDSEYLESAGLNEAGEALGSKPEGQAPAAETSQASPTQAPVETFDFNGTKYPTSSQFQFIHDGKTQKVDYNTLVNGYRRATHLQQKWDNEAVPKLGEYDKIRPEFDKYKGFYDKYNALQDWSEKNPQDWARLEQIWKNKDQHLLQAQTGAQPGQPNALDPIIKEVAELKNQFKPLVEKIQTREQQDLHAKEEAQKEQDISFVKNEIVEFQKEFPEVDLNEKDPDGVPLWAKITQWGTSKGFIEFTPAAMMYLKPRIAETYGLRARSEAMKSAKADHQAGIVKRSTTPIIQGQSSPPQSMRKMSYGEIAEQAKNGLSQAS